MLTPTVVVGGVVLASSVPSGNTSHTSISKKKASTLPNYINNNNNNNKDLSPSSLSGDQLNIHMTNQVNNHKNHFFRSMHDLHKDRSVSISQSLSELVQTFRLLMNLSMRHADRFMKIF